MSCKILQKNTENLNTENKKSIEKNNRISVFVIYQQADYHVLRGTGLESGGYSV